MKIISHRGYWNSVNEKNTEKAFARSFLLGFGTETDVRDFNREIRVSHDMATGEELNFHTFLALASSTGRSLTLALNIKADGLAKKIYQALEGYPNLDCFVFDMSVPDMRSYFDLGIPVFTRMSEVEQQPVWIERSAGVWLDGFDSEWFDISLIKNLLLMKKRVCIVSPELHGRNHLTFWALIKDFVSEQNLMLCTDYPEQAAKFFLNN